jgi:phage terminase large subunit-like protein
MTMLAAPESFTIPDEIPDWDGFTYATPRNLERRTIGGRIANIAAMLGKPGMPWQRCVWDVAGELDAFGNLVYEIVIVTVPRQSGKTTMYGPVQIERAITSPGIKTFYTAQTGKDARSRFNDLKQLLEGSELLALRPIFRLSAGDEAIIWPNGSRNKIFAPVEAALHGETPPLVGLDEIWEFDELLGDALLEGAIIPAQVTLAGRRQVWLISTAGTAASAFLRKWVERGRQSVLEPGSHPRVAFFDASLPEGADPFDPVAIARFHPAVKRRDGTGTQPLADLMELSRQVSHATWLRAFCNVWTETTDPLIPEADWDALADPTIGARRNEIAISWDVAPDNTMGAVLATWRDDAGRPCTRVLHAAPDTQWMEPLLLELHAWQPAVFGADDGGQTRKINDRLRRALGADAVTTLNGVERGIADDEWLTAARDQSELLHDGSKTLSNAVAHLVLTRTGDTHRFSRSSSSGPIAAVIASSVGLYLYDHRPAPEWTPATRY